MLAFGCRDMKLDLQECEVGDSEGTSRVRSVWLALQFTFYHVATVHAVGVGSGDLSCVVSYIGASLRKNPHVLTGTVTFHSELAHVLNQID